MKQNSLTAIRRENLRHVLDLLTLSSPMTRQEMAERTGLSLMSVTNLVDVLKEQSVLGFTPLSRQGMGRRADAISLSGEKKAWLALDISGREAKMLLLGFDLKVILEGQGMQAEDYLTDLRTFLRQVKEQLPKALAGREILGVAVVTPGPYEIASDTVKNQRIPELNGVKIKALFQEELGAYEYYVDEDVKLAVRAFAGRHELGEDDVLYYLFIGEGVGGATVHNRNMIRGLNATAGDAGQLTDCQGRPYEERLGLAAYARALGLDDTAAPERLRQKLAALAASDPDRCRDALMQMASVTAEMLHGVLWLLDPTRIIIDCRYARPFGDDFAAWVKDLLQARFDGTGRILPEITAASQCIPSVLRGAVYVLQRTWLERVVT